MEFSWETLQGILAEPAAGIAICTIIDKHGSVPRGIGTRMLVRTDGSIEGTIGGGIGEHEIITQARQAINKSESLVVETSLAGEQGLDSPAICGGWFQTLINYWSHDDRELAEKITLALGNSDPVTLLEVVSSNDPDYPTGAKLLLDPKSRNTLAESGISGTGDKLTSAWLAEQKTGILQLCECKVLVTPLAPPAKMVVFGAGHLAVPLVEMASWCGFEITVIDDRQEFACPDRFPRAAKVLVAPMENIRELELSSVTTYFILITREHRHDDLLLRQLLGTPYAYLGMIGSRRRTSKVKERLINDGFPMTEIKALHAPIGVEINAQTPEEIAISIMAEVIAVKNRTS
ncbi:MAG: XdhC/CoxI family protein [Pseudomonadota bacterium]|nr:XdhC/CoxI family protein [Pseudomonadota bacterium]